MPSRFQSEASRESVAVSTVSGFNKAMEVAVFGRPGSDMHVMLMHAGLQIGSNAGSPGCESDISAHFDKIKCNKFKYEANARI